MFWARFGGENHADSLNFREQTNWPRHLAPSSLFSQHFHAELWGHKQSFFQCDPCSFPLGRLATARLRFAVCNFLGILDLITNPRPQTPATLLTAQLGLDAGSCIRFDRTELVM